MISFIVPAHNEQALLPQTLNAIGYAARALDQPFETLVVDDASTDATAEISADHGARVVSVDLRQIAAVRNAGAREARGDVLIFVDADTIVPQRTLRASLNALRNGYVAGGARVRLEPSSPLWARALTGSFALAWFGLGWAAGCYIFTRRDAFERAGGFNEDYFLGEELYMSRALQQQGQFIVLRHQVITSARKFRRHSLIESLQIAGKLLGRGPASWKSRDGARWWYDSAREA